MLQGLEAHQLLFEIQIFAKIISLLDIWPAIKEQSFEEKGEDGAVGS